MEVSDHLHVPAASTVGKEPRYPLDRRLGGPQSWCGYGGGEEKPFPVPDGNRNPGRPIHSLVSIITNRG